MIQNTCQVCESKVYVKGLTPTCMAADGPPPLDETDVYLSVGGWSRNYVICTNCAKRLIAELESFIHDSRAFAQLTLGDLQERMNSVARD